MKRLPYSLFIIGCTIILSCNKVTNQVPDSIITPTNFYKTASDADNAINGCYDALQNLPSNLELWGDGRADILASTSRSGSSDLQVVNGNVSSSYTGWDAFYSGHQPLQQCPQERPPDHRSFPRQPPRPHPRRSLFPPRPALLLPGPDLRDGRR